MEIAKTFNKYFIEDIGDCFQSSLEDVPKQIYEPVVYKALDFKLLDMKSLKCLVKLLRNTVGGEEGLTTEIIRKSVEPIANTLFAFITVHKNLGL